MITLITPTGGRHESFALCEKWMANQTVNGAIQWIVIDDCSPSVTCTMGQEYYRGPKDWKEGINTQRLNMDFALTKIKGDYIFVIEDDDYYAPEYLETYVDLLQHFTVVGEGNAKYYSLRHPGYKEMRNRNHASLCQTGIRKEAISLLERAVNSGELYFDIQLWTQVADNSVPACLFTDKNLAVGIKGMPGRTGIGVGHKQKDYYFDANYTKLREWIGNDSEHYLDYLKKEKQNEQRRVL